MLLLRQFDRILGHVSLCRKHNRDHDTTYGHYVSLWALYTRKLLAETLWRRQLVELLDCPVRQLHRIMDEAQAAISTLCVDLNGLSGALSHLYRAVYRHDSWTCPCSIQPALLELTRSYELSYARIRRHAIEIQVCYNVKHPQQAHRAIEDFLEFQKPPFSPHSSIEMYFGQIQRYLESSPGWM